VLTGSLDHTARLWDAATGRPLGPYLSHPHRVLSVAFSPEGAAFASGCGDGFARLWEAPAAVPGTAERAVLWVQSLTGLKLDPDDAVRVLDAEGWAEGIRRLQALGGPPAP
jgi:WD40 repeat protein